MPQTSADFFFYSFSLRHCLARIARVLRPVKIHTNRIHHIIYALWTQLIIIDSRTKRAHYYLLSLSLFLCRIKFHRGSIFFPNSCYYKANCWIFVTLTHSSTNHGHQGLKWEKIPPGRLTYTYSFNCYIYSYYVKYMYVYTEWFFFNYAHLTFNPEKLTDLKYGSCKILKH